MIVATGIGGGDAADRRARRGGALGATARRRPRSGARSACWSWAAASSGSSWRRPGAAWAPSVALVEAADRILAGEEPFVSEEVADGAARHGVDLRVGVKAVGGSRGEGGRVSLRLEGGEELRGDELLVAVGRRPADRRPRARERRHRAGRLPRGRRPAAGRRLGLALRDRRRQRPRPADPHGQVPGAGLRRPRARQGRRGELRQGRRRHGSSSPIRRSPRSGETLAAAEEAGIDARAVDVADLGERRRQLPRPQHARNLTARRRRGARG